VAYRPVTKLWLCKQRPLLHNARSIHTTIEEWCFLWSALWPLLCNGTVNMTTAIEGLCFLRGPCREVILKTTGATQLVDKSSVQEAVKKRVSCQGMALKRRHCVWYLECVIQWDCYSSCVRIRCQETASGDCNRMRTLVFVCQWSVKCNYESCVNVVSKSQIQSKTSSIVTLNRDNILWRIVTYTIIARQRGVKHVPAEANAPSNRMSVARQRSSKHISA
jgi:hypothetical protein